MWWRSWRSSRCRALLLVIAATHLTGCLSSNHTVQRAELERLARAPPEGRSAVRGKQRIVFSASPEERKPETLLHDVAELEAMARDAAKATEGARDAAKAIDKTVHPPGSGAEAEAHAEKDPRTDEQRKADEESDDNAALAVVFVVFGGVFIGIGLAVSEGQRWDGDLGVEPQHPIHLRAADGHEIGWVPIGKLTPAMLDSSAGEGMVSEGIVSEKEGPTVRLRPAPLDRRGFAYGVELGAGGMNTRDRDLRVGLAGRIGIGYFPWQRVGFVAGTNLQTGPKGAQDGAIDVRPHLEAQAFPLRRGAWHAGGYIEAGRSFGSERLRTGEVRSSSSWSAGGGVLVQADLATLLAVVGRIGVVVLPDPGPRVLWSPQLTVGVAVY